MGDKEVVVTFVQLEVCAFIPQETMIYGLIEGDYLRADFPCVSTVYHTHREFQSKKSFFMPFFQHFLMPVFYALIEKNPSFQGPIFAISTQMG